MIVQKRLKPSTYRRMKYANQSLFCTLGSFWTRVIAYLNQYTADDRKLFSIAMIRTVFDSAKAFEP